MSKKKAKPISQSVYSYAFTHSYSMNLRTHVQKRLIVWLKEYDFKMSFNVGCKVHIVFHIIRIKCMGWKKTTTQNMKQTMNEKSAITFLIYVHLARDVYIYCILCIQKYYLKRLNLHHNLNKFSRRQTDVIFLFLILFSKKHNLTFHANHLHCQTSNPVFWKKNKKTYFNILPAENFTQHAKR